jgi:hypothetical protein
MINPEEAANSPISKDKNQQNTSMDIPEPGSAEGRFDSQKARIRASVQNATK